MIVLEYDDKNGCYAAVHRIPATENKPVSYKVELWEQRNWYYSKSFPSFEKAEKHYWDKLKEEFL
jgi:hypothetical protein